MNVFKLLALDGKARAGVLTTAHSVVNTPALMIYTRRGAPLNLTPDMVDTLKPLVQAMQLNAMHFLDHPTPKILQKYGKGAHHFLALQDYTIVASTRDPTIYEYGPRPSNDKGAYVTIHSGGFMVTPENYAEVIDALRPDVYVTMSDEVTSDARRKRVVASVDRTVKRICRGTHDMPSQAHLSCARQEQLIEAVQWMDAGLEEHQRRGLGEGCMVLGAIQGGGLPEQRTRAAKAAAERPVSGFALGGFGTGETAEERAPLLEAALQPLPAEKLRMISGMGTPEDMLEAVEAGVDLFDCSYVETTVAGGYALSFPLGPAAGQPCDPNSGADDLKLNMRSQTYRLDTGPLVAGCTCFTCRQHTRAYVHHLLNTHEMLAEVLLEAHNTHTMLTFFDHMRSSILAGTFQAFKRKFFSGRPT